jgi:hypothetical protein
MKLKDDQAGVRANQEIGVPTGGANQEIGVPTGGANQEIGDPGVQRVPEIRGTLERLLKLYEARVGRDEVNANGSQPAVGGDMPWELKVSGLPAVPAEKAAAELRAYLARGIPAQALLWKVEPGPAAGRFEVKVVAGKEAAVTGAIVLGDEMPPAPKRVEGQGSVKAVEISYGGAKEEAVFWRPLGWFKGVSWMGQAAMWDAGWVWLYIAAYLPVLFGMRAVLRVA